MFDTTIKKIGHANISINPNNERTYVLRRLPTGPKYCCMLMATNEKDLSLFIVRYSTLPLSYFSFCLHFSNSNKKAESKTLVTLTALSSLLSVGQECWFVWEWGIWWIKIQESNKESFNTSFFHRKNTKSGPLCLNVLLRQNVRVTFSLKFMKISKKGVC